MKARKIVNSYTVDLSSSRWLEYHKLEHLGRSISGVSHGQAIYVLFDFSPRARRKIIHAKVRNILLRGQTEDILRDIHDKSR